MKTLTALIFLFISALLGDAAITVNEISKTEFETTLTTNVKVLEVYWVASAGASHEIFLSNSSNSTSENHTWSSPEPITLGFDTDTAGNVDLQVGSTPLSLPALSSFNSMIIQIQDGNVGTTEFTNFVFDGTNVRDLFADDPTENDFAYDHIRIDGITAPFTLTGNWSMGEFASSTDSYMRMYFFQSEVPETSTLLLFCVSHLLLFIRKRCD